MNTLLRGSAAPVLAAPALSEATDGLPAKPSFLIEAAGITQYFGEEGDPQRVVALEELSLSVAPGELICLIGPSGCGKSSFLNIIGGLAQPSTGEVHIKGRPIDGPRPNDVAFVFQESTLFPWCTIIDNIKLGLRFQGVPKNDRTVRARDALAAVGLSKFEDYLPRQLSGGMKQRAQLARALSLQTEILLMDEPFAALDEQTRLVLSEDLSLLLASTKKTIVFVTHSLVEAVFLADRVAVFSARPGRIKAMIEVDEPHPRRSDFMLSPKLSRLRNQLYELLREEIIKSIDF